MTAEKKTTRPRATKRASSKPTAASGSNAKRTPVEIKIGVQYAPRELVLEVDLTGEQLTQQLEAIADGGVLNLTDVKGRQVLIPADKVAYIEIGAPEQRRVGFGAS